MYRYICFINLKHLIFKKGGSSRLNTYGSARAKTVLREFASISPPDIQTESVEKNSTTELVRWLERIEPVVRTSRRQFAAVFVCDQEPPMIRHGIRLAQWLERYQ
jgi:hypothetical protein